MEVDLVEVRTGRGSRALPKAAISIMVTLLGWSSSTLQESLSWIVS